MIFESFIFLKEKKTNKQIIDGILSLDPNEKETLKLQDNLRKKVLFSKNYL